MRRILFHPALVITITLIAIGLWISFFFNSREISQSSVVVEKLQQDVRSADEELAKLQKKVDDAGSAVSQEKIIRDQLLMQKPGEYMLQLPDLPEVSPLPSPTPMVVTPWDEWQQVLSE